MRTKKGKEELNELQKINAEQQELFNALYAELSDEVLSYVNANTVVATVELRKDISNLFEIIDYENKTKGIITKGIISGVETGLGDAFIQASISETTDWFLDTTYKGDSLSSRIHDAVKEAEQATFATVKKHLEFKTNWKSLSKDISKVSNTVGDVAKRFEELKELGLQYANGKLSTKEIKALNKKIEAANKYISQLSPGNTPTKQLKNAYNAVINAVIKQDPELIKAAYNKSIKAKIAYNNDRISRTELSRAYQLSFHRSIEDDPDVTGYRVSLSPYHPAPDQCDLIAGVDNGAGNGVYIKGDVPTVPIHPFCLCMLERYTGDKKPKKYSNTAAINYLNDIDERERISIIGVNNSKYKYRYVDGLVKKGISADSFPKRNMLPKSLIKPRE